MGSSLDLGAGFINPFGNYTVAFVSTLLGVHPTTIYQSYELLNGRARTGKSKDYPCPRAEKKGSLVKFPGYEIIRFCLQNQQPNMVMAEADEPRQPQSQSKKIGRPNKSEQIKRRGERAGDKLITRAVVGALQGGAA